MQIKDLAGLSKPLTRLIEVLSDGIGAVSRPYLIKRDADAKAYEVGVISAALKDVAERHQLPVVYSKGEIEVWQKPEDQTLLLEATSTEERVARRLDFQERKRQRNVENVASAAAAELSGATDIPDEKPDEDWVTRFFSAAQDVSSDQLQELWGRILAGEIKKPGTYSLRTLEFVRNLTKSDASFVEHVGKLAINWSGTSFLATHDKQWLQENRQIYDGHQLAIGELGAMYPTDVHLRVFREDAIQEEVFVSGDILLLVKRGEIKTEIQLPIWKFTGVGKELLELVPSAQDDVYLETLGRFFVNRQGVAMLARIVERLSNGQVRYQTIREIRKDTPQPENGI